MSGNYQGGTVTIQKKGDSDLTDDFAEAFVIPITSASQPDGVAVTATVEFMTSKTATETSGRNLTIEIRGIDAATSGAIEDAGYIRLDVGYSDTGSVGPVFFGRITGRDHRFDSGKLTWTYTATDRGEFYTLRPEVSVSVPITIGEALTKCYESVGAGAAAVRGVAIPEIAFGSDSGGLYTAVAGKPQPDEATLLNAVTLPDYTAPKSFIETIILLCQDLGGRLTALYGRSVEFVPIMQPDGFTLYLIDPTLFSKEAGIVMDVTQPNVITAASSTEKAPLDNEAAGQTGNEDTQDQANVSGTTVSTQVYSLTCDLEPTLDLGVDVAVSEGELNRLALFKVESGTHTIATGMPWRTTVKGRMADTGYLEVPHG